MAGAFAIMLVELHIGDVCIFYVNCQIKDYSISQVTRFNEHVYTYYIYILFTLFTLFLLCCVIIFCTVH